jgi:hypothetical protein
MKKLNILAFSVLFSIVAFLNFTTTSARALTVSPVRLEIGGDPGKTITKTIKLSNEQAEPKTFYVSFENFSADGETNKPNFIGAKDGLATWINAPSQITLDPKEEVKIPVNIDIPADADPGDHFAAIFWGTSPSESDEAGQVAIGGRLGILVLLRVSGDINEVGELVDFSTENNKSMFEALPISFFYRIKNDGNVRINPTGNITIINPLGRESAKLDANSGQSSALPQTTRKFDVLWSSPKENPTGFVDQVKHQATEFKFGRYTAKLDLVYGDESKIIQSEVSFWMVPWQLLSLVIAGLAIMGGLVTLLIRKYTQGVVRKALEQQKNLPK